MSSPLLRFAALSSLLSVVACGSSDGGGTPSPETTDDPKSSRTAGFTDEQLPSELVDDLPLVAPKSELDIPIFSDPVDVAPGDDVTFCTVSNVILEEATIFGESFGAQSPQGHHSILVYTSTPQEPGTGPCGGEDMQGNMLLGGTGGKTVKDTNTLPVNFGVEVPAGSQLVMNHHWINTSSETIHGQSMMLARKLERGGDTVLAGTMIMVAFGWEIPAQTDYEYSSECKFAADVPYVMALGHMHEWGHNVSIDVTRGAGGVESIINRDWTPEEATGASGQEVYSLEDPFMIHSGDTVKLTCKWTNDTTEAIGFPREMCIFFGYTVGDSYFCANGSWFGAEAAQAAGAGDVISHL